MDKKSREYAQDALTFIKNSGSPFLASKNLKEKLLSLGLVYLKEGEQWNLKKNEGYVLTKENRNICSFYIGKNFNIGTGSILISIGHIDSCALKIAPNNNIIQSKINQINVECYGAGLWHTWFDRSLGLSGQVVYNKDNKLVEKLIQINKPLFFLPSLAIHLQQKTRYEFNLNVNYENHLKPILSTVLYDQLIKGKKKNYFKCPHMNKIANLYTNNCDNNNQDTKINDQEKNTVTTDDLTQSIMKHALKKDYHSECNSNSSPLLYLLSKELNCSEKDIIDFELCLMDAQEPCFSGIYEEFIEGARFDNLLGSYCVFEAYTQLVKNIKQRPDDGNNNSMINTSYDNNLFICIGYDHEEIGSLSEVGARSYFTKSFIERIIISIFKKEIKDLNTTVEEVYGNLSHRSLILNVDMSHCSHPNYPETVQTSHHLHFHHGIAIKYNTNKNYVTAPYHVSLLKKVFELYSQNSKSSDNNGSDQNEQIPYQNFMVKNETPCGSTVGAMVAANLSMPGLDIGIPQLAMHSIREIAAIHDIYYLIKGILAFYTYYSHVLSICV
uniref:aspartyl aminopeptidase n=1 Tax=Piliocolobus tephrosceles TaxID=591936 RepID=A0A8C9GAI1_9PRIM